MITIAGDILLSLYTNRNYSGSYSGDILILLYLVKYLDLLNIDASNEIPVAGAIYYYYDGYNLSIGLLNKPGYKEFMIAEV